MPLHFYQVVIHKFVLGCFVMRRAMLHGQFHTNVVQTSASVRKLQHFSRGITALIAQNFPSSLNMPAGSSIIERVLERISLNVHSPDL